MNGHELVMPFVVCKDQDGPYDPLSYAAGFEMGLVYQHLMSSAPSNVHGICKTANLPQLDLIAMKHGFVMSVEDEEDDWSRYTLTEVPK